MKLIWANRANSEWKKIATYIHDEFGHKAAEIFLRDTQKWERYLLKSPECGFLEQLLKDKTIPYRSILLSKHNKLIYYIKEDEIRIVDIWDMRRNPEILAKRIRTQ